MDVACLKYSVGITYEPLSLVQLPQWTHRPSGCTLVSVHIRARDTQARDSDDSFSDSFLHFFALVVLIMLVSNNSNNALVIFSVLFTNTIPANTLVCSRKSYQCTFLCIVFENSTLFNSEVARHRNRSICQTDIMLVNGTSNNPPSAMFGRNFLLDLWSCGSTFVPVGSLTVAKYAYSKNRQSNLYMMRLS